MLKKKYCRDVTGYYDTFNNNTFRHDDVFPAVQLAFSVRFMALKRRSVNTTCPSHSHTHTHTHTHTHIQRLTHTHTHTHTHSLTHTHIHTHLFHYPCGDSHRRNGFLLYRPYILSPYTNPTPKLSPHRRLFAFLDFQKT